MTEDTSNTLQMCAKCDEPIKREELVISVMNKKWHSGCHVCSVCTKELTSCSFQVKDEKVYCQGCFNKAFPDSSLGCCDVTGPDGAGSPKVCAKCNEKLERNSQFVTALNQLWHEECLVCTSCSKQLVSVPFHAKVNDVYCSPCWKKYFMPKCKICEEQIDPHDKYTNFKDNDYHVTCFVCDGCKNGLVGKRFLVRNDKNVCFACLASYARK